MFPIHQIIFNEKTPKISKEANADIIPVVRWFMEETFTYIRVFKSIHFPMLFPIISQKTFSQGDFIPNIGRWYNRASQRVKEFYLAYVSSKMW